MDPDSRQLYTPAMLADILGVSARDIRRWYRAGFLAAASEVMHLPQFDYAGLTAARQLAEWTRHGATVKSIQTQVDALRARTGTATPIQQMPITVEGKRLVLRHGDQYFEASGQLRFGFDSPAEDSEPGHPVSIRFEAPASQHRVLPLPSPGEVDVELALESMIENAIAAEEAAELEIAIQWYRTALAIHGPNADLCFQIAELLYRDGDVNGARERYFIALELDPELVEARANLGCVLAECGQTALAIAAFEGTLAQFADFADVHFHLARVLDETGDVDRAVEHWRKFLELSPASPWADEAQLRLTHISAPLFDL